MQQSDQEIYSYETDSFKFKKIFNSLLARKFFIFGCTAFITLLAIIFALNITPIYQAGSSFTSPSAISIININKLQITSETEESVFSDFLTLLSSKEFQKEVFIDGDYLTKFNPNNNPIDDVNSFISGLIASVIVTPPPFTNKDFDFMEYYLTELPYSISMKGTNPIVIANYLNELVAAANANIINELRNFIKQKIEIRLNQLSIERQLLVSREKQKRLNEIDVLTDSAKIAGSLGIEDNNLNQLVGDKIRSDLTLDEGESLSPPDWYLYGEKALLERVDVLKNRLIDDPFIPELVDIDYQVQKLQSGLIDTIEFNSMQLSKAAIAPIIPIKPNKRMIVLLAFIGSFIFSILLALAMDAIEPDEKTLPK